MDRTDQVSLQHEIGAHGIRRRALLRGMLALGGGLVLGACGTAGPMPSSSGGRIVVRWLGGGIMELAMPHCKQIAYDDAWIWNNAHWSRFGISKPPEYASKEASSATWRAGDPTRSSCC